MKLTLSASGKYLDEEGWSFLCSGFVHHILGTTPDSIGFDVRLNKFIGCKPAKVVRNGGFVDFVNSDKINVSGSFVDFNGEKMVVLHWNLGRYLIELGLPEGESEVYFRLTAHRK